VRNAPVDGEPFRPHKLLYCLTYAEHAPKPTFVLDISDQMERKLDAIFAFGSQFEGKTALGDVFAGGDRPIREQITALHAQYGSDPLPVRGYWTRCGSTISHGELLTTYWTRDRLETDEMKSRTVRRPSGNVCSVARMSMASPLLRASIRPAKLF
jgi:hypothetical protein